MMVRLKPNGSARINMDMSWPKREVLRKGRPCSPNEGMKNYEEFEKAQMTSDTQFRRAIF